MGNIDNLMFQFNTHRNLQETNTMLWKNFFRRDGECKLHASDIPIESTNLTDLGSIVYRDSVTFVAQAGTTINKVYHFAGDLDSTPHVVGQYLENTTRGLRAIIEEYDSGTSKVTLRTPIAGQVPGDTVKIYQNVENVQQVIEAVDRHRFINHIDTPLGYTSLTRNYDLMMLRVNNIPDGLEFKWGEECIYHNLITGLQGGVSNYPIDWDDVSSTDRDTLVAATEMYHLTAGEHTALISGPTSDASLYHTHGTLAAEYFQLPAGEVLPAYKIVISDGTDAYLADNTILANANAIVGITLHSAAIGATVNIKENGVVENGTWAWTPGSILYLSTAGDMTHTPPATGFCMEVGIPITATKVNFNPQMSIELA